MHYSDEAGDKDAQIDAVMRISNDQEVNNNSPPPYTYYYSEPDVYKQDKAREREFVGIMIILKLKLCLLIGIFFEEQ